MPVGQAKVRDIISYIKVLPASTPRSIVRRPLISQAPSRGCEKARKDSGPSGSRRSFNKLLAADRLDPKERQGRITMMAKDEKRC